MILVKEIRRCKTCQTKAWAHSHCRACLMIVQIGHPYCEKHLVMRANQLLAEVGKILKASEIVQEWDKKIVEHMEAMEKARDILKAWDDAERALAGIKEKEESNDRT